MKKSINLLFCCAIVQSAIAQETSDYRVERACLNYLEGFYEGDTAKLNIRSGENKKTAAGNLCGIKISKVRFLLFLLCNIAVCYRK